MKLLLFAAGLLCLIGVARGCDEEQLVREVVKAFVTYTTMATLRMRLHIPLMTGCISTREAESGEDEKKFLRK
jgi:hypothetical protein